MYSTLTRGLLQREQDAGQAARLVGYFDGDQVGDLDDELLLFQQPFGLSQSRTTKRRMPNCWVSAMDSVRMLSRAWPAA